MQSIQRILSVLLTLSLLIASLPVSALAEDMQIMQVMEIMDETQLPDLLAEETVASAVEAEPVEVTVPDGEAEGLAAFAEAMEIQTEAQALAETEKPAEDEAPIEAEAPASTEEPIETQAPASTEEPIEAEAPASTEEPIDVEDPAGEELPSEAVSPEPTLEVLDAASMVTEPVLLEGVEYVKGGPGGEDAQAADLAIILPEAALPLVEIEGLVCDADYWMQEGVLIIAAAWLDQQEGDEIALSIHGADMLTYIQPIALLCMGEEEMQLMNSGEYDVSRLLINGEPASNGSGEGWSYADGRLQLDITNMDITLSGSANLLNIYVFDQWGDERGSDFALRLDSVNIQSRGADFAVFLDSLGETGPIVHLVVSGNNTISSEFAFLKGTHKGIRLEGDGTLNAGGIQAGGGVIVNGPCANLEYIQGNLTLNSGTVNLSGSDAYAVKGNVTVNGGELNIEKEDDGLSFRGIMDGGLAQYGGKTSMRMSGASEYSGTGGTSLTHMFGGKLDIRIDGATSAYGIYANMGLKMEGGDIDIDISNTSGAAGGVYYNETCELSGGSLRVSIDGGAAEGIAGRAFYQVNLNGADVDVNIGNADSSAVGLAIGGINANSGSLDVYVNPQNENGAAIKPYYTNTSYECFMFNGGSVNLQAAKLTTMDANAIAPDGSTQLMNGSCLIFDGAEVKIYPRKQIIVNGVAQNAMYGEANIGGEGWEFDYATDTLFLNNFHGESIALASDLNRFTVQVSGENSLQQIQANSADHTIITGGGSLNMVCGSSKYGWGIDAGRTLSVSKADISMHGYSSGFYAQESIDIASAGIIISGGRYGVYTGDLAIDRESRLRIETAGTAFNLSGACTLAGLEIETAQYNEITIENGAVASAEVFEGLIVGGEKIQTDDLLQDQAGDGWQWIAVEQMLRLGDYSGAPISANVDFLRLQADESIQGIDISAKRLTLSADEGTWLTDVEIQADHLEILSGRIEHAESIPMLVQSLSISGGSLKVPAGIEAADTVLVSGGKLEAGVLFANVLKVQGGDVKVNDSILIAEEEGIALYYGLVAENCAVGGGSLYTAEPVIFGSYSQHGGTAHLAANAAVAGNMIPIAVTTEKTFSMDGGKLTIHNGYGMALYASYFNVYKKATVNLYGDSGVFYCANEAKILGKAVDGTRYTTMTVAKGKVQKLAVEADVGLAIGNDVYGRYIVENTDLSGEGWKWDHAAKTLSISGMRGSYNEDIYIDCGAVTLHLPGGGKDANQYLEIVSLGALTLTGDGELDQASISSPKAIKVKGCKNLSSVDFYTNSTLTIENAMGDNLYYEAAGNVNISGCNASFEGGVATNKNLTIKNSYLNFWLDEYNTSSYANGKTSVSNSIISMKGSFYSKKGTSIAKDAAVFKYNWSAYRYELQKSATLGRDWIFAGSDHFVGSGKTLTIKAGKCLYVKSQGALTQDGGTIKGSVVVLNAAQSVTISGENRLTIGGSLQLSAATVPAKTGSVLKWTSSDISLCAVDASGKVTATGSASRAGETVIITAVCDGNDQVFASHEILLVPAAQEILVRDGYGRYARSVELWMDPSNKTASLKAQVYPGAANQDVKWKSSNTKIVTVDENGTITAKKAGTANVYAIAGDGSKVESQKVKVTVRKAPSSIKITNKKPTLGYDSENGIGSSLQLKVTLTKGSASTVRYTSANANVAIVDANGLVTAKGPGTVKITAQTYNGKKSTVTVNVKAAPDSILISPGELTIGVGDVSTFSASIPKNSYGSWTYSVSNTCGRINASTGEFTALKPGDVQVTAATFNGKVDSCIVHVLPAPDMIELGVSSHTMGRKEKFTLKPAAKTADGMDAAASYTYSSSNKKVATVSASGVIQAKKAGTVTITVTAHNGVSARCKIIVQKNAPKLELNTTALTLSYDAQMQLGTARNITAKLPGSDWKSELSYSSSDTSVAVVSAQGRVTAAGLGTSTITVTGYNGKKASCKVTVAAAPSQLLFEAYELIVPAGQYQQGIKPVNAPGIWAPEFGSITVENLSVLRIAGSYGEGLGAHFDVIAPGESKVHFKVFNGAEATVTVKALPQPDILEVSASEITVKKGKTKTITVNASRSDGQECCAMLSTTSQNSKTAYVSKGNGQMGSSFQLTITGKGRGTTYITVYAGNQQQQIKVKVT